MRQFIPAAVLARPVAVGGEEQPWVAMSGAEITTALNQRTLQYQTARQRFYASGKTLYESCTAA